MERLSDKTRQRVIGTKETRKHLMKGELEQIYLAQDAAPNITDPLRKMAAQQGVEIAEVDTMKELGKACGIEVGAAAAGILKGGDQRADH